MSAKQPTVCVLTSRGMAAISSIALTGAGAQEILEKVFQSSSPSTPSPLRGTPPSQGESFAILHGSIFDGNSLIDEVVVGCEGPDSYVIHCHGNPLLVERVVKLLQSHGAKLTDAEDLTLAHYTRSTDSTIEAEAKLAMQKSTTLLGVKLLQAQIDGGLSAWVHHCIDSFDKMQPEALRRECIEILERSNVAKRIIEGVRIVIAGPPNSGKSTLLNCLAGQQQVIVSETAGTTRDWVSVTCQLGPLKAEFIDTAGLDDALAGSDAIEHAAQRMTKELLESCDVVLYVTSVISKQLPVISCQVPVICVYNKCDLTQEHKNSGTQEHTNDGGVFVSAKYNDGIDSLVEAIVKILGISDFDVTAPVAFTQRQQQLLSEMIAEPESAKNVLKQL